MNPEAIEAAEGREELAKVLGAHYGTSAAGDDHLWAMADILIERGFGKVREARAAELEAAADALRLSADNHEAIGMPAEYAGIHYGIKYMRTHARWLRSRAAAIRAGEA